MSSSDSPVVVETPQAEAKAPEQPKTVPIEQVLQNLQSQFQQDQARVLDVKDQLLKLQDQLLAAQDAAFKSQVAFSNAKEQYLAAVVNMRNNQIKELASKATTATTLPKVPEESSRDDNVEESS